MKVRVVLFAKPRELVGQPNIDLALPAGSTAADAWSQLSTQYDLGPLPRSFRCAVNSEYAGWDDPLKEGDELAVIPPVSGGAIGERRGVVALREEPLDPMAIAADIRSEADGALVLFQGIVREHSRGKQVRALVYEAYGSMANKQMEDLAEEARRRWPISDVAVVHRIGTLQVGEVSVVIAVAASHRGEAFDAAEWLIDELKQTVPIWKKEVYTEGEAWIDDRPYGRSHLSRDKIRPRCGSSSVGRAPAFQVGGREFESRLPLSPLSANSAEARQTSELLLDL